MASRIGSDLRRSRTRREIQLSEVEAATRIRARFLRAIENEEWEVLPGGVYTRGFIRTYASFLGLDGDRLAEDYRRDVEGAQRPEAVVAPAPRSERSARLRASPLPLVLAVGGVILVAAIAIFAIPGDGGEAPSANHRTAGSSPPPAPERQHGEVADHSPPSSVSMRLTAEAEVWVCVLGAGGGRLVNGQILEAGAAAGPFHSGSFTVSFGNGEVTMLIDGKKAEVPATASPIGYSIDASGALTKLSEAERPTCT